MVDASDRRLGNAGGLGHVARAPVCGLNRLFPGSHAYDLLYSFARDLWLAARTRRIFLDAPQPLPNKPTAPTVHVLALPPPPRRHLYSSQSCTGLPDPFRSFPHSHPTTPLSL